MARRVLVSGCFDLLHAGHVEFFNEAAKYGDLYVRLGTDANIKELKDHETLYSDEERVFMVASVKCVHDAALSTGRGRFDFEEDMKVLRPDVYVCNDDASGMETRVAICERQGVQLVVLPRKPHSGLTARSSTDMKARLRELVISELQEYEARRAAEGPCAYNYSIPWRLCFAGGWLDLKWCNELHPGCVVTLNIKFHPGICKDQCGLATSSRKVWMRLWQGNPPKHLEAGEAAKFLFGAENFAHFAKHQGDLVEWEKQSYSAGSQDHCGLLLPGINRLNYTGSHWPSSVVTLNDPQDPTQVLLPHRWLESVLHVVEIPFVSRPEGYNSQRVNNLTDQSLPLQHRADLAKAIATASDMVWRGIVERDADMLGRGLSATMVAWSAALPYTVDPYGDDDKEKSQQLRDFWKQYDRPATQGCLFSGAGGGFLFVISETEIQGGMHITLNHDHIAKPFPSDDLTTPPHPLPFT